MDRYKKYIALNLNALIVSIVFFNFTFSFAQGWVIQTVDTTGHCGSASLALDSNGYPHISYGWYIYPSHDLRYAFWNGSAWTIETIDTSATTGLFTSISLDGNDYPHICYCTFGYYFISALEYAYWNGSQWILEEVDTTSGFSNSLQLDSEGNPHISTIENLFGLLEYVSWTGTDWSVEVVDTAWMWDNTSLKFDTNGKPHIAYVSANGDLRYACKLDSIWDIQGIETDGYENPSLVLDANDNPHISYYDNGGEGDLKYARWTGIDWEIEIIDSAGFVGYFSSIVIDSDGMVHVAYHDDTNDDLKYAYKMGANWMIEIVDSTDAVGEWISLVLDRNNAPHISYCGVTPGYLKYAYKTSPAVNEVRNVLKNDSKLLNCASLVLGKAVIKISSPELMANSAVLMIYNSTGRSIKQIPVKCSTDQEKTIIWDGRDEQGRAVPAGVYIITLQGLGFTQSQKIVLLK